MAHGYLFAGPRGTGKTSTARVLAKAMCCEQGPTPEPCCECSMCQAIASGSAMDLVEIDAASNRGIDDIRELRERIGYAPTQARLKFYILDEAHMLTPAAANALLKTLEEPPDFVHFVLATTELHSILPTIRSRCQTFEFRPIPQVEIAGALQQIAESEGVDAEEAALGAIARAAGGAMRDAESIFDQVIAYGRGEVTLEVVNSILGVTDSELLAAIGEAVAQNDIVKVFELVDEIVTSGKDIDQLLEDLSLYFRDLLRLSLGAAPSSWMRAAGESAEGMQAQAAAMGPKRIGEVIEELGEASRRIRDTAQKPLLLEVTLAHMASIPAEGAMQPPASEAASASAQSEAGQAEADVAEPQAQEAAAEAAEPSARPEEAQEATGQDETAQTAAAEDEPSARPVELPDGALTLDAVTEHWPRVVEALGATGHPSIAAIIGDAEVEDLEDENVRLSFPGDRRFEYERARDEYAGAVLEAVEAVFGRPLQVEWTLQETGAETVNDSEGGAGEDHPTPDATSDASHQQETVLRLLEEFDGTEETPG